MKVTIESLQDTFQIGYNAYLESRVEAGIVLDMFHNRQYSENQLSILEGRGQPKETFNVIKLFTRQLVGYYSTVLNTIKVSPAQLSDITIASLLNDTTAYVARRNHLDATGDTIKRNGFLSGIFCAYVDVQETGEKDQFGRKLKEIKISAVPPNELVLDPSSTELDYSDADWIHRFKWVGEDKLIATYGKEAVEKLDAYANHLNVEEAEFTYKNDEQFQGKYKVYNNYLIVHTVMKDENGKIYSVYWSGDEILSKKEMTYKDVKFPYRVVKLNDSDKVETYGLFREVIESQNAINQAIIQIQMLVNSNKVFVGPNAVDNIEKFRKSFNRVNAVVEVLDLNGYKIENMNGEIQQQYIIIDKAFDRIQRILGINDSFLGMAFASDSGRKVKLQQNATIMALRYIDTKLDLFYRLLGWDIVHLIKQYYTATQTLRITDEKIGERWIAINQPLLVPDENMNPTVVYDEDINPDTNEPNKDEYGNIILVPLNNADTDISFADVDLIIESINYNDEDEKNQLMMETMLNGNAGKNLATVNPAGYFKILGMSVKSMKTKYSPDIAEICAQTASMLQPQPEQQSNLGNATDAQTAAGQLSSPSLQLPQGG